MKKLKTYESFEPEEEWEEEYNDNDSFLLNNDVIIPDILKEFLVNNNFMNEYIDCLIWYHNNDYNTKFHKISDFFVYWWDVNWIGVLSKKGSPHNIKINKMDEKWRNYIISNRRTNESFEPEEEWEEEDSSEKEIKRNTNYLVTKDRLEDFNNQVRTQKGIQWYWYYGDPEGNYITRKFFDEILNEFGYMIIRISIGGNVFPDDDYIKYKRKEYDEIY